MANDGRCTAGSMNSSSSQPGGAHTAHTNGHLTSMSPEMTNPSNLVSDHDSVMSDVDDVSNLERSRSSSVKPLIRTHHETENEDSSEVKDDTERPSTSSTAESNVDTPASFQQTYDARDERPASSQSRRASKRKATVDEDDFIANNPELYGLRRSVRSHARPHYATANRLSRHVPVQLVEW